MSEEQRQKAAYRALEELLEPEPRLLQNVWATAQPLSGDEFEQVPCDWLLSRKYLRVSLISSLALHCLSKRV